MAPKSSAPASLRANLLLLAGATLTTLLLGEVLVRVAIVVFQRPPVVVSDPHAGWVTRPNMHDLMVTIPGGRFRASTDEMGHRLSYPPDRSVPTTWPAVLLLGDSFVFGLSVSDKETFPWQLAQRKPDHRVIHLGVSGWGTDQELVSLEDFLRSPGAGTVSDIVVVVFENDFSDVQRALDPYLLRTKPVFHVNGATLERGRYVRLLLDHLMDRSRIAWLIGTKASSLIPRRALVPDSGFVVVVSCLDAIRRRGAAKGARVHVLAHRRIGHVSTIRDALWHDFLARAGAVDITDAVRIPAEPSPIGFDRVHWSTEGHRRVALLIEASLNARQ